jgi:hypothetical protein
MLLTFLTESRCEFRPNTWASSRAIRARKGRFPLGNPNGARTYGVAAHGASQDARKRLGAARFACQRGARSELLGRLFSREIALIFACGQD